MRGIHYLLGGSIAAFAGTAQAGGNDYCRNFAASGSSPAVNARLVCRIKVDVTVESKDKCTASVPDDIYVYRNPDGHPVLMLFYIKDDESNTKLTFDKDDGVTLKDGSAGTKWDTVFTERKRQDRRVFFVVNTNPKDEKFKYMVKVKNDSTDCDSVDPTIHNRN